MTQEEIIKEARRNEPIATDGCILTNNEEMDGHWETTCMKMLALAKRGQMREQWAIRCSRRKKLYEERQG